VRLPGLEDRSPVRVILDSGGRLRGGAWHVLDDAAPTWLFGVADPLGDDVPGVRHFAVPRAPEGLDTAAVLDRLGGEGVTSVLVEGGAKVARSLLQAELVDVVLLFRSPVALGEGAVPALAGIPLSAIEASPRFRRVRRRKFGADMMTIYERR
jgi:diaminohydroxyphosphoribosylaminopyrimidine deaminase/5-amino-6-(5-phosphoribosylamino)uracil reductase